MNGHFTALPGDPDPHHLLRISSLSDLGVGQAANSKTA
jgi:hypothetical protein